MRSTLSCPRAGGDEGVSPVIAVILMVAITVVSSATVYVWTSGFNQPHDPPAKSLAGQQRAGHTASATTMEFTVLSVSPGLFAQYLKLNDATQGRSFPFSATGGAGTLTIRDDGGSALLAATQYVGAGDVLEIAFTAGQVAVGDEIHLIETNSGTVIARYSVR